MRPDLRPIKSQDLDCNGWLLTPRVSRRWWNHGLALHIVLFVDEPKGSIHKSLAFVIPSIHIVIMDGSRPNSIFLGVFIDEEEVAIRDHTWGDPTPRNGPCRTQQGSIDWNSLR